MLMSALSPKARALIEQAHEEVRAPVGEMERLEALLDAQLGAPAPNPATPGPLPAPRVAGWKLVTSLSVGAALIGGGALWALRPSVSHTHVVPAISVTAQAKPPEVASTLEPAPAVETPAPVAPAPAPSAKAPAESKAPAQPAQDALAQEVSLLSRATSNLRAGRAGAALKLLDEHQKKFPQGMLAVERRAVRAQALCTLKRVSEGRAELAQLAPQSPAAGRAKQLCDAASNTQQ